MERDGDKLKVLVIDDDEIARELMRSTLSDEGYEVIELGSAIGASRVISRSAVDAVVLDVMMPDLNGDKLAKLLRNNVRGKELVIVLVSSRSLKDLQAMAMAAHADAVVEKQNVRTQLASTLHSVLLSRSIVPPSSK